MPNHVYSNVKISGDSEDLAKFVSMAKKDGEWDINELYRNPLSNFTSPVRIVAQEEYDAAMKKLEEWKASGEPFFFTGLPMTLEMQENFIKSYGTANWYHWANQHWGSKWGIYEIEMESEEPEEITLRFQTAWTPAKGLWKKVSEFFPSLRFVTEYVDEGGFFCGTETYESGVAEGEDMDVDSEEGKIICESVGCTFSDAEEESEEGDSQ